ncbi:MAG: hypothetical protein LC104_11330 [Bacteroidales bacterium]|nr:hypothetical protein [Bacteroidales bacterium]
MNSTLKMVVPIVLVCGGVFALTVIKKLDNTPPAETTNSDAASPAIPLQFTYLEMKYDPTSDEPRLKHFAGFHEVSDAEHPASFWFQQVATQPTHVQVLGRSCTSCTAARVGVLPPDAMNQFIMQSRLGAFPLSPFPLPDLLTAATFARLNQSIQWTEFDFDHPDSRATVPAATEGKPGWGLFQMGIKVTAQGPKTLSAGVGMKTEAMPVAAQITLSVSMVGVNAFQVVPETVNLGSLPEGAADRRVEVHYWSATRSPNANPTQADYLPPPTMNVADDDPFVTLGKPRILNEEEVAVLARTLSAEAGQPIQIRGAYRVMATVHRKLPDGREPDIGPFEKYIGISGPGTNNSRRVTIKGVTTGLVSLASGDVLKLGKNGEWNVRYGDKTETQLVSDRPGLEIELVPEETIPAFLQVTLGPPEDRSGRRYWTLKVAVPPNTGFGNLPRDASIVLRSKGPTPQKVRIPVQGIGFRRG